MHTDTDIFEIPPPEPDTIVAIATPPGEGAVGIVRLSGPEAGAILRRLFRRPGGRVLERPRSHRLYYGHIVDPDGAVVDEVLAVVMARPHSFTGEDVAEIQAHGGPAPLRAIVRLALAAGARLAEPGEFTQRAFLNGRLDLTQAEAVLDIIRARTDAGLRAAEARLAGGAGERVRETRGLVIALLAALEAAIDFADEDIAFLTPEETADELALLRERVEALLAGYARGRLLREGAATAIVGRPNVGKSSLLNALLGEARAIVTEVPGTTRDVIEEQIDLAGVPLRLVDTAGIRATEDVVERIGVQRSRASLAEADLALLVLDRSQPLTPEDLTLLDELAGRPHIRVLNKADLPPAWDAAGLPGEAPAVALSAVTGQGLPDLEAAIADRLLGGLPHEDATLATARQADAARRAADSIAHAQATLADGGTEDLLAVDLMAAADALGEITGETARAEVIEELFRRFCVGK